MCMLVDQYYLLSCVATQYAYGDCSLVEVTYENITRRFPLKQKLICSLKPCTNAFTMTRVDWHMV
jgi:hypothetical protein